MFIYLKNAKDKPAVEAMRAADKISNLDAEHEQNLASSGQGRASNRKSIVERDNPISTSTSTGPLADRPKQTRLSTLALGRRTRVSHILKMSKSTLRSQGPRGVSTP
jgi:hypothetical protein